MKNILTKAYGINKIVKKTSDLYMIENTRIHIDDVQGLGSFIELETLIKDQSEEDAYRENKNLIQLLDIKSEDFIIGSYSDMV